MLIAAVVLGVIILGVGGYLYLAYAKAKKTYDRMTLAAETARVRGDIFCQESRLSMEPEGRPFRTGQNRYADTIVYGVRSGRPMVSFTYNWKEGSKSRSQMVHALFVGGNLPTFTVEKRYEDGDRPSNLIPTENKVFNIKYNASCANSRLGEQILTPQLIEFIKGSDTRVDRFVISNGWLFASPVEDFSTNQYASLDVTLPYLDTIASSIPAAVKQETKMDSRAFKPYEVIRRLLPNITPNFQPTPKSARSLMKLGKKD